MGNNPSSSSLKEEGKSSLEDKLADHEDSKEKASTVEEGGSFAQKPAEANHNNPTSIISYPRGIENIKCFLINTSILGEGNMKLSENYEVVSNLIKNVAEFIVNDHGSLEVYRGNVFTNYKHQSFDSQTPTQKLYHDGGKYHGTFKNSLRHGYGN
jgi:hypothetical protein